MSKGARGRKLAVALLAICSLLPISAAAAEVQMQALLDQDGSGRLFVNNSGEPPWSWEACSRDLTQCKPFGIGREIDTGSAPAGTVFRVSGGGDSGLSPVWHGNVVPVTPPSVEGEIRANELVTPRLATWSGGWEGDFDLIQLAACVFPNGSKCTPFTHPKSPADCKSGGAVLDPAFTGRYLRVADERYGRGTAFTLEAVNPLTQEVWQASPITAVAVVGRIKPARGAREESCGMPPLVEASVSGKGVATVLCRIGCRATLVAQQGRRTARVSRNLPSPYKGARRGLREHTLQLRAKQLRRFEPGRVRFLVKADGRRVARRAVLVD